MDSSEVFATQMPYLSRFSYVVTIKYTAKQFTWNWCVSQLMQTKFKEFKWNNEFHIYDIL